MTCPRGPRPVPSRRAAFLVAALASTLALAASGLADHPAPEGPSRYSSAAPPADYPGPTPTQLALAESPPAAKPADREEEPPRLAAAAEPEATPARPVKPERHVPAPKPAATAEGNAADSVQAPLSAAPDPIAEAKALIAECKATFANVRDYTCTFYKLERINGRLGSYHVMQMKARPQPFSVYFKFVKPNAGREAIFAAGRYANKAVVHDVGIGKLIAGTLKLDPRSEMAMEDCRHPITEAGLGHMIDTIYTAWTRELRTGPDCKVAITQNVKVNGRHCILIESSHPIRRANYLHHMVKVYIDTEHRLPIRFEAYDWPHRAGVAPEKLEEYTYANLRLNVGLKDSDFDPNNRQYSFGRF